MTRRAFSMVEVLVVFAVLGMVLTLSIGLLAGTMTTYEADAALGQRILRQTAVADRFREDVARSTASPPTIDDFIASPLCLILSRPDGAVVVYLAGEGWLDRFERLPGQPWRQVDLIRNEAVRVEFPRAAAAQGIFALRYSEHHDSPGPSVRNVLQINAALGGDVK